MGADRARVSVVVLSYNRPRLLAKALASIRVQSRAPAEVLVVDNRSAASGAIEQVVREFPGYVLIRNADNLGFSGGMNTGLARTTAPYVHLTEDDVVLDSGCLDALATYAEDHPGCGLLSGIMLDADRQTILSAGGIVRLGGIYRQDIIAQGEPGTRAFSQPYDVQYIPGAMMFARSDVWQALGGFREDFFVYSEDADLCFRARKGGYPITVVPAARVSHFPAAAGVLPETLIYHKQKNFFALYLLHASPRVLPEFFVRYVALGLIGRRSDGTRRALCKALAWNLRNMGTLLRDRGRVRLSTARIG
jgi:N-acetylglucosaminyl-diphospho-decaprenol L-rhamnosyltransferase